MRECVGVCGFVVVEACVLVRSNVRGSESGVCVVKLLCGVTHATLEAVVVEVCAA